MSETRDPTRSPVLDAAMAMDTRPSTVIDIRNYTAIPTGKQCRVTGQHIVALVPIDPVTCKPQRIGVQFQLAPGGFLLSAEIPQEGGQPIIHTLRDPVMDPVMALAALDRGMEANGFQRLGRHHDDMVGLPTGIVIYHAIMPDGYQMTSEVNLANVTEAQHVDDTVQAHYGMMFSYTSMLEVYATMHRRLAELAQEGTELKLDWPQMLMHHRSQPRHLVLATIEDSAVDAYIADDQLPVNGDASKASPLRQLLVDLTDFCRTHLSCNVELSVVVDGDGGPVGSLVLDYTPEEGLDGTSGSGDDDSPGTDDDSWALRLAGEGEGLDPEELAKLGAQGEDSDG